MVRTYAGENPFAQIVAGTTSARMVYENDVAMAFWDINPIAPVHILVIPKGPYLDYHDFLSRAEPAEQLGLSQAVLEVIKITRLDHFRIMTNVGGEAGQTVFHCHLHILSGHIYGNQSSEA